MYTNDLVDIFGSDLTVKLNVDSPIMLKCAQRLVTSETFLLC
jgi:hypothetical protein